ncbi:hypothetical protein M501DRAFT_1058512 [Patellaria atrata CBS 101060]|uniref:G domain-containing protein n=1 Tax=Patellaria atrata CBS 101060 TaxID=1346257 RepID=A0A9P4VSA4_9PEZI|nr:hypothetical protein M501DRAFT_1058512 [Patellaria atrata CBS 101060]
MFNLLRDFRRKSSQQQQEQTETLNQSHTSGSDEIRCDIDHTEKELRTTTLSPPDDAGPIPAEAETMPEPHWRKRAKPKDNAVVPVCGMTGTEKSTFISNVAGQDVEIGHGLQGYTHAVIEVHCQIGPYAVTLVDTPGFDDTNHSGSEVLAIIAEWIRTSYEDATADGEAREKELCRTGSSWGTMVAAGANVRRYNNDPQVAIALAEELLRKSPAVMKIQKELVEDGKCLVDTDRGSYINEEMMQLRKRHEEELRTLKEEMDLAATKRSKTNSSLPTTVIAEMERNNDGQLRLLEASESSLQREIQEQETRYDEPTEALRPGMMGRVLNVYRGKRLRCISYSIHGSSDVLWIGGVDVASSGFSWTIC